VRVTGRAHSRWAQR